jgi:hypothetical protein
MITPVYAVHQDHRKVQSQATGAIRRAGVLVRQYFRPFCLVYYEGVKILLARKRRAVCGLVLFVVLLAFVVPLYAACVIVASEFLLTPEHYVRMSHARDALQWISLFLQVGAGWLLYSGFSNHRAFPASLWRLIGVSLASIVCTFILGFFVFNLAEHYWYRMAQKLF